MHYDRSRGSPDRHATYIVATFWAGASVNGGRVAAYRFGRVLRYQRADLDRFIEGSRERVGDLEYLVPPPARGVDGDEVLGAGDASARPGGHPSAFHAAGTASRRYHFQNSRRLPSLASGSPTSPPAAAIAARKLASQSSESTS